MIFVRSLCANCARVYFTGITNIGCKSSPTDLHSNTGLHLITIISIGFPFWTTWDRFPSKIWTSCWPQKISRDIFDSHPMIQKFSWTYIYDTGDARQEN